MDMSIEETVMSVFHVADNRIEEVIELDDLISNIRDGGFYSDIDLISRIRGLVRTGQHAEANQLKKQLYAVPTSADFK